MIFPIIQPFSGVYYIKDPSWVLFKHYQNIVKISPEMFKTSDKKSVYIYCKYTTSIVPFTVLFISHLVYYFSTCPGFFSGSCCDIIL